MEYCDRSLLPLQNLQGNVLVPSSYLGIMSFAHFRLLKLQELFPFKTCKRVPFHAKYNGNDKYFPHNRFKFVIL